LAGVGCLPEQARTVSEQSAVSTHMTINGAWWIGAGMTAAAGTGTAAPGAGKLSDMGRAGGGGPAAGIAAGDANAFDEGIGIAGWYRDISPIGCTS
jgi:hypothetical protein